MSLQQNHFFVLGYQGPLQHWAVGKQKNVDENRYGSIYQGLRFEIIWQAQFIKGKTERWLNVLRENIAYQIFIYITWIRTEITSFLSSEVIYTGLLCFFSYLQLKIYLRHKLHGKVLKSTSISIDFQINLVIWEFYSFWHKKMYICKISYIERFFSWTVFFYKFSTCFSGECILYIVCMIQIYLYIVKNTWFQRTCMNRHADSCLTLHICISI